MKRLIRTDYTGHYGDRAGRSTTLEGALRAALIRIAHGEYRTAQIHDERFGTRKTHAVTVQRSISGISVIWIAAKPIWFTK